MSRFMTLWARETGAWFHATTTYIMLAAFSAVTGLIFWRSAEENIGAPLNAAQLIFEPVYLWLMIVLLIAVVSMQLFAEDRREGMLEMILTVPVTDWQIILAKYAGALTVFTTACLPLAFYPLLLSIWRQPAATTAAVDLIPLAGGFLALFLCGVFFSAFGVLCASIFRGQLTTVIVVFFVCGMFFFVDRTLMIAGDVRIFRFFNSIALTPSIRDAVRGIFDTRPLVLCFSATLCCLFAAQRILTLQRL